MPVPARAPRPSTLILLAALSVLPIGIFLPSINGIARTFEVDYGLISLALSAYAAMSAGLQLVMGPLSDRFGRRPVALASLALFIAASIGTGTSLAADLSSPLLAPGRPPQAESTRARIKIPPNEKRATCCLLDIVLCQFRQGRSIGVVS